MFTPLTQDLVTRFYGKPMPRTSRGWAYLEGDDVLGVFGLCFDQPGERRIAFMEVKPEFRERIGCAKSKRALIRGGRMLVEMIKRTAGTVHAAASEEIETAPSFLERLGFEHLTANVYGWPK